MKNEKWTLENEKWKTAKNGKWKRKIENGEQIMGNGKIICEIKNEKCRMGDVEWRIKNEERRMENRDWKRENEE